MSSSALNEHSRLPEYWKRRSKHELGNLRLDAVDDKGGVLALAVAGLGRRKSKGMSQR
jgi:hypothetical protein